MKMPDAMLRLRNKATAVRDYLAAVACICSPVFPLASQAAEDAWCYNQANKPVRVNARMANQAG